ncbi:MAG: ATP-binding protein [Pseudomonadota bacterium]
MASTDYTEECSPNKISFNLAIIGGGRTCKNFLELLQNTPLKFLDINLLGVCDIDPMAVGMSLAKEMGIHTTDNFQDIFKIKNLDAVIELTGSRKVLCEILRYRPKGVGVLEHNIARLIATLFPREQRMKSVEQQLVLEKMAADFLIHQANERISIVNPDFKIIEVNEAYLKAAGKSKEEVIGAHCYEITHGLKAPCSSSQPEMGCPLLETMRTGESAHVIHEHPHSGEHSTFCDLVAYPLKDEKGNVLRVIEISRDLTEKLTSTWERRVNLLKADLKKLVQEDRMISLGKLAASCVHEINNPIQGLLTFSHLMLNIVNEGMPSASDLKDFQNYLSLMSRELERCGNIVSGLLSLSRVSPVGYTGVELNEILNEVLTLTKHKMELQSIKLKADLSPTPLVVQGDVNQLQQCFLNLVFNAIEAMPWGGRLDITSELDKRKKTARIGLRDTGYGIPEKHIEHIFDPFFTTKEEGEGTGLGLSIVYGIIKNHRGDIKVASEAGKGCSFTLDFPIS